MASAQCPDARLPAGVAVQPLTSIPTQPWRNGGGTTRALAEAPDGSWRISLADVGRDGPYSPFEGMTRLSLVVQGSGVTLRDGTDTIALQPGTPAEYDGERAWQATLHDGPVVAVNAMAARDRFRARISLLREATRVPSGCFMLVLTVDGRCSWRTEDEDVEMTLHAASVMTRDPGACSLLLAPLPIAGQTESQRTSGLTAVLVVIEPVSPFEVQKRGNDE